MKVYKNLSALRKINFNSAVALGIFDGVHLGHQKVIRELIKIAEKLKIKSVVVTFEPHPESISYKEPPQFINTLKQRLYLMQELGVDACIVIKFTRGFAMIPPEYFIKKVLLDKLNMVALVVSSDYRFGKNAAGNTILLHNLSDKYNFKLKEIKTVTINKKVIKSTLIRTLLNKANLNRASKMLNRYYFLEGIVVKGSRLGAKIGYPTVNLRTYQDIILPAGVYIAMVEFLNKRFNCVVNIGFRPTVKEKQNQGKIIEAHILNFNQRIYGRNIKIFFFKKIRAEKKFKDLNGLKKAIGKDIKKTKDYLNRHS